MSSGKIKTILNAAVSELPPFFEALEEWCADQGVEPRLTMQFVLMLDELLTNVALHAYQGQGGWAEVCVEVLQPIGLLAQIRDKGPEFDPTRRPLVDVSSGIEERQIGGLGVHFIHELADEFAYQREQATNLVTIKKMAV